MMSKADIAGGRGGFTIVEVVVAMGLFLLGMASVLGLLSFGAALTRTASLRTDSAAAIEAVCADLEEQMFPLLDEDGTLTVGPPVAITDRVLADRPDVSYSAVPTPDPTQRDYPGGALEYRIDVTMSWKSAGATKQKKFTTLLTREIPFSERLRRQFVEKP